MSADHLSLPSVISVKGKKKTPPRLAFFGWSVTKVGCRRDVVLEAVWSVAVFVAVFVAISWPPYRKFISPILHVRSDTALSVFSIIGGRMDA